MSKVTVQNITDFIRNLMNGEVLKTEDVNAMVDEPSEMKWDSIIKELVYQPWYTTYPENADSDDGQWSTALSVFVDYLKQAGFHAGHLNTAYCEWFGFTSPNPDFTKYNKPESPWAQIFTMFEVTDDQFKLPVVEEFEYDSVTKKHSTVKYAVHGDEKVKLRDGQQTRCLNMQSPFDVLFSACKPGTYMMGSPDDEVGRFNDEKQVNVTVKELWAIARINTTQQMYEHVMGNNPSHFQGEITANEFLNDEQNRLNDAQRPVDSLNWFDTIEFLNELSKAHGLQPAYVLVPSEDDADVIDHVIFDTDASGYMLPTEQLWEYFARAGVKEATYCGNFTEENAEEIIKPIAWYYNNSGGKTQPVARLAPNPWGIYDVLGNTWEWTGSQYFGDREDCKDEWGQLHKLKIDD